ncbi:hypothetical protein [Streptomyces antarcticus]|uniref:hypothetical protein n=1 Tax=Streptomyces antarcticus TaxID=2996458 RepID=UPI00226FC609|nr:MULTISPECIES: hypothetical protein [unclassified Streptomyces]MCY0943072.1 hypothetical protein [Streptomyces sp. H34-AA3]MCY0949749.1 hypothetical protein [Streptomyces sp. H27-S2]MCZ4084433.1 hypothetical protein [Streptomyces sp. H34-S5]
MDRWDRCGRRAACGAALALTPYLLIMVLWVVGSLVGVLPAGRGFGVAEWLALNTVTIGIAAIGMAAIGITPALALLRPWGKRIPGAPVALWRLSGVGVPRLAPAVRRHRCAPGRGR